METDQKNKEISQSELDLTDDELNRIFFGSENKTSSDLIATEPKSSRPKKLERQNKSVIPPDLSKPIEPPEETRPQGRPLIWTPEKKEQLKAENAKKAEQKRKEKLDRVRLSKISTQGPPTNYERDRIVDSVIQTKDEIEKHITEKRTILKDILAQKKDFTFLRSSISECKHLYKLRYFDTYGKAVISCDKCSVRDEMTVDQWNLYLSKNRKKL